MEVGRGLDYGFEGEGFGAVVFGKQILNGSDEIFSSVGGNFVPVDFKLEGLPEELGSALGSDSFDDGSFVSECGATTCKSDEHFLVAFPCFDGAGDLMLAVEVLEVELLGHLAEFFLFVLKAGFENFKFPALGDNFAGDCSDLSGGVGERRVFGGGFFNFLSDSAKVEFLNSRYGSGRGCGFGGRFGFCCYWHGCWHGWFSVFWGVS